MRPTSVRRAFETHMPNHRCGNALKVAVLVAVLVSAGVGVTARQERTLAYISSALLAQLQLQPLQQHRILLHGNVTALGEAAARLGVRIVRTLDDYVVVMANARQVALLQL